MNTEQDPRVRAFWRQAAAVIAASGGITGESQQKLRALADHLQLTESEWQLAWQTLQSNDVAAGELTRYEQAFVQFLRKEFARLPHGLLSLKIENKAARIGIEKYQISEVRTRQIIEWECERQEVKRVSRPDAEQYVEQVIIQQLDGQTSADDATCERLVVFSRQWGLDRDLVELFIRDALQENRVVANRQARRSRRWQRAWRGGLVIVVLVPIIWLVINQWWLVPRDLPSPAPDSATATALPLAPWWPTATLAADLQSWDVPTDGIDKLYALGQEASERRQSAYLSFWQWLLLQPTDSQRTGLHLLTQVYRCDPQPPPWEGWLLQPLHAWQQSPGYFPLQSAEVAASFTFWSLVVQLTQVKSSDQPAKDQDLPNQARTWLQAQLALDPLPAEEELSSAVRQYWARELWSRCTLMARVDPARGAATLPIAWANTQPILPASEIAAALQQAVFQVLQRDATQINVLRPVVPQALENLPSTTHAAWIEMAVAWPDSEATHWLQQQLLLTLDPAGGLRAPAETQRYLRQRLREERMRQWAGLATAYQTVQQAVLPIELEFVELAQTPNPEGLAQLAASATLYLWLAEQLQRRDSQTDGVLPESQRDWIAQQFVAAAASRLSPPPSSMGEVLSPADERAMEQAIAVLGNRDENKSASRGVELERLERIAQRVLDIRYELAQPLATYYLQSWPLEESLTAERVLARMRRWPRFVLALADQLPNSDTTLDQALILCQVILQVPITPRDQTNWKSELAGVLREKVERDLDSIYLAEQNRVEAEWLLLAKILSRVYRERETLRWPYAGDWRKLSEDWPSDEPSRWLWLQSLPSSLAGAHTAGHPPTTSATTVELNPHLWDWLATTEPSELERLILGLDHYREQELARWSQRIRHERFHTELIQLRSQWQTFHERPLTVAQRLAWSEYQLLQLWKLASDVQWHHELLGDETPVSRRPSP